MNKIRNNLLALLADKTVRPQALDRKIAEVNLKIVNQLKRSQIRLRDAERSLYNMDMLMALREGRCSTKARRIIEWGMQLEDSLELLPEKIQEDRDDLRKLSLEILGACDQMSTGRTRAGKRVTS